MNIKNVVTGKRQSILFIILIFFFIGLYLKIIINQYQTYPWVDFPLGWDPIVYVVGAKIILKKGVLHYALKGSYSLYYFVLAILGSFFDIKRVEIVMPVILSLLYAVISSLLVFRYTKSYFYTAVSIFLCLFSIRSAQLLGLFHANLLAFILFLLICYLLPDKDVNISNYKYFCILFIMSLLFITHMFTLSFIIASVPFIYKLFNSKMIGSKKFIIYSLIIFVILLPFNINYIRGLFIGLFSPNRMGVVPWFKEAELSDYLLIYNNSAFGLFLIVVGTLYIGYKYRKNIPICFISIFSILSLVTPLLSLVFPISLPPNRILLLCQYQVLLPIFLYDLSTIRTNVKMSFKLNKSYLDIRPEILIKIISIFFVFALMSPSYGIFINAMDANMKPWISELAYTNLCKTKDVVGIDQLDNIVFVFHGSSGMVDIWRRYAYMVLDEHYGYYGRLDDVLGLVPPENLEYLSDSESGIAYSFYYGTSYGERIPLSELNASDVTVIILNSFYGLPIPNIYKSTGGITIINMVSR